MTLPLEHVVASELGGPVEIQENGYLKSVLSTKAMIEVSSFTETPLRPITLSYLRNLLREQFNPLYVFSSSDLPMTQRPLFSIKLHPFGKMVIMTQDNKIVYGTMDYFGNVEYRFRGLEDLRNFPR